MAEKSVSTMCDNVEFGEKSVVRKCVKNKMDQICDIDPFKSQSIGTLRRVAVLFGALIIQFAYYTFCFIGLLYDFATDAVVVEPIDITWMVIVIFGAVTFVVIAFMHQYKSKRRRVGYYAVGIYFLAFGLSVYTMYLAEWNFWEAAIEIIVDSTVVHTYPVGLLFLMGITMFILAWYTLMGEYRVKQEGMEACTIISVPTDFQF